MKRDKQFEESKLRELRRSMEYEDVYTDLSKNENKIR